MNVQEILEEYLMQKMMKLCPGEEASNVADSHRAIEELGLFDMVTPFGRVADALGQGEMSDPRVIDDAPDSLRISREHRYSLSRWPLFEFVILESHDGLAWGHTFARRVGLPAPVIPRMEDLRRWSHVETEVRKALGPPASYEEWSPWASAVYECDGRSFSLCYVFGLLQSAEATRGPTEEKA
jgi:hypothetical protein